MINLTVDWTFFLMIPLFLASLTGTYVLIIKPTLAIIEKRADSSVGLKAKTERLVQENQKNLSSYEETIALERTRALTEREKIIAQGRQEEAKIVSQARSEAERTVAEIRKEIASEKDKAGAALRTDVSALAENIFKKLVA